MFKFVYTAIETFVCEFWIYGMRHFIQHFGFRPADRGDVGAYLPIEIHNIEPVEIGDAECADAKPRESQQMDAADSAHSRDRDPLRAQRLLFHSVTQPMLRSNAASYEKPRIVFPRTRHRRLIVKPNRAARMGNRRVTRAYVMERSAGKLVPTAARLSPAPPGASIDVRKMPAIDLGNT